MKFGKSIRREAGKNLRVRYIDYKGLKKNIKLASSHLERQDYLQCVESLQDFHVGLQQELRQVRSTYIRQLEEIQKKKEVVCKLLESLRTASLAEEGLPQQDQARLTVAADGARGLEDEVHEPRRPFLVQLLSPKLGSAVAKVDTLEAAIEVFRKRLASPRQKGRSSREALTGVLGEAFSAWGHEDKGEFGDEDGSLGDESGDNGDGCTEDEAEARETGDELRERRARKAQRREEELRWKLEGDRGKGIRLDPEKESGGGKRADAEGERTAERDTASCFQGGDLVAEIDARATEENRARGRCNAEEKKSGEGTCEKRQQSPNCSAKKREAEVDGEEKSEETQAENAAGDADEAEGEVEERTEHEEKVFQLCVALQEGSSQARQLRRFVIWNSVAVVKIIKKKTKLLCRCPPPRKRPRPATSSLLSPGSEPQASPPSSLSLSSRLRVDQHPCLGCCLLRLAQQHVALQASGRPFQEAAARKRKGEKPAKEKTAENAGGTAEHGQEQPEKGEEADANCTGRGKRRHEEGPHREVAESNGEKSEDSCEDERARDLEASRRGSVALQGRGQEVEGARAEGGSLLSGESSKERCDAGTESDGDSSNASGRHSSPERPLKRDKVMRLDRESPPEASCQTGAESENKSITIMEACFSSASSVLRRECWYSSMALPSLLSTLDTLVDEILLGLTGRPPNEDRHICPICLDVIVDPVILRACCHRFCITCLAAAAISSPAKGELPKCPSCRTCIVPVDDEAAVAASLGTVREDRGGVSRLTSPSGVPEPGGPGTSRPTAETGVPGDSAGSGTSAGVFPRDEEAAGTGQTGAETEETAGHAAVRGAEDPGDSGLSRIRDDSGNEPTNTAAGGGSEPTRATPHLSSSVSSSLSSSVSGAAAASSSAAAGSSISSLKSSSLSGGKHKPPLAEVALEAGAGEKNESNRKAAELLSPPRRDDSPNSGGPPAAVRVQAHQSGAEARDSTDASEDGRGETCQSRAEKSQGLNEAGPERVAVFSPGGECEREGRRRRTWEVGSQRPEAPNTATDGSASIRSESPQSFLSSSSASPKRSRSAASSPDCCVFTSRADASSTLDEDGDRTGLFLSSFSPASASSSASMACSSSSSAGSSAACPSSSSSCSSASSSAGSSAACPSSSSSCSSSPPALSPSFGLSNFSVPPPGLWGGHLRSPPGLTHPLEVEGESKASSAEKNVGSCPRPLVSPFSPLSFPSDSTTMTAPSFALSSFQAAPLSDSRPPVSCSLQGESFSSFASLRDLPDRVCNEQQPEEPTQATNAAALPTLRFSHSHAPPATASSIGERGTVYASASLLQGERRESLARGLGGPVASKQENGEGTGARKSGPLVGFSESRECEEGKKEMEEEVLLHFRDVRQVLVQHQVREALQELHERQQREDQFRLLSQLLLSSDATSGPASLEEMLCQKVSKKDEVSAFSPHPPFSVACSSSASLAFPAFSSPSFASSPSQRAPGSARRGGPGPQNGDSGEETAGRGGELLSSRFLALAGAREEEGRDGARGGDTQAGNVADSIARRKLQENSPATSLELQQEEHLYNQLLVLQLYLQQQRFLAEQRQSMKSLSSFESQAADLSAASLPHSQAFPAPPASTQTHSGVVALVEELRTAVAAATGLAGGGVSPVSPFSAPALSVSTAAPAVGFSGESAKPEKARTAETIGTFSEEARRCAGGLLSGEREDERARERQRLHSERPNNFSSPQGPMVSCKSSHELAGLNLDDSTLALALLLQELQREREREEKPRAEERKEPGRYSAGDYLCRSSFCGENGVSPSPDEATATLEEREKQDAMFAEGHSRASGLFLLGATGQVPYPYSSFSPYSPSAGSAAARLHESSGGGRAEKADLGSSTGASVGAGERKKGRRAEAFSRLQDAGRRRRSLGSADRKQKQEPPSPSNFPSLPGQGGSSNGGPSVVERTGDLEDPSEGASGQRKKEKKSGSRHAVHAETIDRVRDCGGCGERVMRGEKGEGWREKSVPFLSHVPLPPPPPVPPPPPRDLSFDSRAVLPPFGSPFASRHIPHPPPPPAGPPSPPPPPPASPPPSLSPSVSCVFAGVPLPASACSPGSSAFAPHPPPLPEDGRSSRFLASSVPHQAVMAGLLPPPAQGPSPLAVLSTLSKQRAAVLAVAPSEPSGRPGFLAPNSTKNGAFYSPPGPASAAFPQAGPAGGGSGRKEEARDR
ncbi:zinc finger, C3HC4 type (RING finger) domain-containing protein [Toxoplasma gondii FOU]|uniref:Zinc finger, C3HC4 type (RING finger) domain-containing protein n=2 Tax=Toxoplasma gondii TaxID=5811 RepID=A0A086LHR1_TOXGO|nr:zinc finger, C3HC4 type (RING finger) domain-containing protein [Toxoplasma gondii FOU]PUA91545.1 zinc finger, C3HC4 type (RING finger) domain-containing protein [Toxoplasma gondii TgCATBr9]